MEKLKEAIEHCKEVQQQSCTNDQCKADHKQLEDWLKELLILKTEVLGLDNPWPLRDVLKRLRFASKYLLNEKSYDGHNHEEINICIYRAEHIIQKLENK